MGAIIDLEAWKDKFLKAWKDPVGSTVIAGVILSVLYLIPDILVRLFSDTAGLWPIIKPYLQYDVTFQVWLILLIAIPLMYLSWPRLKSFKKGGTNRPVFFDYTEDNIFDIDWSWEWKSHTYKSDVYVIDNLYARCPACGSRLEVSYLDRQIVSCIRIECDWEWPNKFYRRLKHKQLPQITGKDDLLDKVETEIDRKIHTGEWKR